MKCKRKVAIVTGGTRGIGLGIATCLAKDGFAIMLCGRRKKEDIQNVLDELARYGVEADYAVADVSDNEQRKTLLAETETRFGRLDVLVNNAGVAPEQRVNILEAGEESFERLMRINLQGPYFLTQAAAKWMVLQHEENASYRGTIINVGSISAEVASVSRGDYCISKAGIGMATMLWATRLAEHEIDVFEIRPGVIETDMTSGVKAKYDKLIGEGLTLQKRWGKPEDVGRVATAMARGDLPYATGQVVNVDGGLMMRRL